jgi:hypothetical protein
MLDHFFHNELGPRKTRRLQNAEGPKNTFPELVIEKTIKIFQALGGPSFSQCTPSGGLSSSPVALYKQTG